MPKLLIVSSQIHKTLAKKQLDYCLSLVKQSDYEYETAVIEAGTYEVPFIINSYHQKKPFDGYIALGLVLKSNLDHFHYINTHISQCFTQFALQGIAVGNGILSANSVEELADKLDSGDPCQSGYVSAFHAVNCLIQVQEKLNLR